MDEKTTTTPVMYPGTPVHIGAKTYVLPPLDLATIQRSSSDFEAMSEGKLTLGRIGLLIDVITHALRRNYPEVDRETIAAGIDLGSLGTIAAALVASENLTRIVGDSPVLH